MALVQCPICNKRISSKAPQCPHCNTSSAGDNDSALRIAQIKKSQRLMNQSFITMTLFIGGVVVLFWGGEEPEGVRLTAGAVLLTLGFVGYLFTRVQMVINKRKSV
ncbi:zinc ribbon domain-containing protein [Shewanella sp. FJAT-52076]|uniref:zinc ribbon domain-containing protein n=1 Tax=Shewanella sp. FJAT-52076 TaxID=2864202 RepID=UPI001C65E82F|nr:zinc ribbon domain-containing protein [Shewanella sp. FJAT-52076]QYJ77036.1 zinc ribbon domain-containing protein [Shewanella sp. FJAT-52076]